MSASLRAIAAAALLAACAPSAAQAPISEQWRAVELDVQRVEIGGGESPDLGSLVFRGGLHLASADAGVGGLSGLEVLEDGRLIAVTDNGAWFSAQLELADDGTLVGLSAPRLALMRDENGEPFETKEAGDAEGLTQLPDGRFAVSFEQTQSIRIYDLNRDGPFGAAARGPALADVERLPPNRGLEALAATQDGALLVGEEGAGESRLWIAPLDAQAPSAPIALYPVRTGFALVSLDRAPDGAFIALERFFAPILGARIRVTRLSMEAITAREALVAPEELALLAPPLAIDNFEAVAATRNADGGVRLYIVSDNNFSDRQRTLLYAFDVVEGD